MSDKQVLVVSGLDRLSIELITAMENLINEYGKQIIVTENIENCTLEISVEDSPSLPTISDLIGPWTPLNQPAVQCIKEHNQPGRFIPGKNRFSKKGGR